MKAYWLISLLLALLFCPAIQACEGEPDCVRVGSWNIAWLGSEKRSQQTDPATIEEMARLIADVWSIDLISLQEINTGLDTSYRGERLSTAAWKALEKALKKKGYQSVSGQSGQAQRIVLAWRKPVELMEPVREIAIPEAYRINDYCRSGNLRKPLAALYRAGAFDFWAIGLHLKSGYGGNTACANAVRGQQIYYLEKSLPALRTRDRDLLLIGDFNASSKHESLRPLFETGFIALTDRQYRHPESHNRTQGAGQRGSVIDMILVNPVATSESRRKSTSIYKPDVPEEFTRRFSDHFPVWSDFNTGSDDD